MATGNMYRKFSEIWTRYFLDVQADRRTDMPTSPPQYFTPPTGQ